MISRLNKDLVIKKHLIILLKVKKVDSMANMKLKKDAEDRAHALRILESL